MPKSDLHANDRAPLVSVIMPYYNRAEFITEAIESVIGQSFPDWELIVVDDGSTDAGPRIVSEFEAMRPGQIRAFTHKMGENKGASASRHLGIEKARGEYITFLDSDDVYVPEALKREVAAFETHPEADAVCGTLVAWFSWSGNSSRRERDFVIDLVLDPDKLYQPPDLLIHNLNANGRKPGIDCVMLRSDFARKYGVFEADYRYAWEDQVFWSKVSLFGRVYVIPAILAKYRQHDNSTCAVETEAGQDIPSMNIFLDWLERFLRDQQIDDTRVWKALRSFQRRQATETRFRFLKQIYRRLLPLSARYRLRDQITRLKMILSRTAHRHK